LGGGKKFFFSFLFFFFFWCRGLGGGGGGRGGGWNSGDSLLLSPPLFPLSLLIPCGAGKQVQGKKEGVEVQVNRGARTPSFFTSRENTREERRRRKEFLYFSFPLEDLIDDRGRRVEVFLLFFRRSTGQEDGGEGKHGAVPSLSSRGDMNTAMIGGEAQR